MIIYIDRTIAVHGNNMGLNEKERVLFAELAISHQRGNCLLCGDIESIEWLINSIEGISKSIYSNIRNRFPQLKSIVEMVETVLVLSYEKEPVIPDFISGKDRTIYLKDAVEYKLGQQCSLVAENLSDCFFYRLMGKRYIHDCGAKGVSMSFRDEHGGGNTIDTVFEKCVQIDKVLTLCVVDSDLKYGSTEKYPQAPTIGATAEKLVTKHNSLKESEPYDTYELYCLPIHEIENLIPTSAIEEIVRTGVSGVNAGLKYLKKLQNLELHDAILYYDFKNGCSNMRDDAAKTYWKSISKIVNDDTMPALHNKILKKALDVIGNEPNFSAEKVQLDAYLVPLWKEIGLKVFTWGCANQPIRA